MRLSSLQLSRTWNIADSMLTLIMLTNTLSSAETSDRVACVIRQVPPSPKLLVPLRKRTVFAKLQSTECT